MLYNKQKMEKRITSGFKIIPYITLPTPKLKVCITVAQLVLIIDPHKLLNIIANVSRTGALRVHGLHIGRQCRKFVDMEVFKVGATFAKVLCVEVTGY